MNEDNKLNDIKIDPPKIPLLDTIKYKLGYFQGKSKVVTTVVGVALMGGVSLFVAYASLNRSNVSLHPDTTTGAANPSCYLSLARRIPTPSPSPSPSPSASPLPSPTKSPSPTPVKSATPKPTAISTPTPTPGCVSSCTTSTSCVYAKNCSGTVDYSSPCGWGWSGRKYKCVTNKCTVCSTPSPTPTPTPACVNCQYQVDLFYGPVIQSFAGGVRYSTTNRLLGSKSDYATFQGCNLNTVSPITPPTVSLPAGCDNPIANKYLVPSNGTSYFDTTWVKLPGGYIYANIKNTTTKCTYDVGLASYKANGSNIDIQNLNDYSNKLLGPGQTVELMVKMPMNNDNASCHYDFEKPAVYLYPETKTNVSVKVNANGVLTKTIPDYGNGWYVSADPNGIIDNKYDYLFYEASLNEISFPKEGWVVKYEDLNKWFDANLKNLGLNSKETLQFKEYWNGRLPVSNYYEIKLMDNSFLKKNMDLVVNPTPDTVIRLDFAFKALDQKENIVEPKIITPARKGFTVVEWGGFVN